MGFASRRIWRANSGADVRTACGRAFAAVRHGSALSPLGGLGAFTCSPKRHRILRHALAGRSVWRVDLPVMTRDEAWFFRPLAWQFLFVIGVASRLYSDQWLRFALKRWVIRLDSASTQGRSS